NSIAASSRNSMRSPQAGQGTIASRPEPNVSRRICSSRRSRRPTGSPPSSGAGGPGEAAAGIASARPAGVSDAPGSQRRRTSEAESGGIGLRREASLRRLGHLDIALPAFVLELDVLDRDRVGARVQVRQRLILRYPAAVHLIGQGELAGFVVELDRDVLAE